MLKLAFIFAGVAAVFTLAVWSVNSFLAIDDLAKCRAPSSGHCAPADAIVAISGGDTPARTQEAIKLYKAGWAPLLVFSGAALDSSGPSNAAVMRMQALASGVPASAIITDETAADTAQNAAQTARLLGQAERIILVTSPYHQRRASLEFEHIFGERVTIVNHPTPTDHTWPPNWYFTSTGWWLALSELVKTVVVSL